MYKHRLLTQNTNQKPVSICTQWDFNKNKKQLHENMHVSHILTVQKHDGNGVWWHFKWKQFVADKMPNKFHSEVNSKFYN